MRTPLCECRRILRQPDPPTEIQRRLDALGRIQNAATGRVRVVLVDGWYRERRIYEIGESRAILLRPWRTERPAVWLPWPALLDSCGPSIPDVVDSAARLLARLHAAGNTGLVRYAPEPPKIRDL